MGDKLKELATAMIFDALRNVEKGNQYADNSKMFLRKYSDSWCSEMLDIEPEVIARALLGVQNGKLLLGSFAVKQSPKPKDYLDGISLVKNQLNASSLCNPW